MILLTTWVAFMLSLFSVFPLPYNTYIFYFGIFMAVVHLLEYLGLTLKFKGSPPFNFFQTIIFGFAHWLPILKHHQ